ncbi:MAG: cytochrome ubiquinol oxidase subunit I [Legionellales bacterium]|nr:cytochrome ubiquinol oxidase subunit I [Legionellales bacterium]
MQLDPFLLARIQFAANITFHILFPTITIALSWILLFFKLKFNKTHEKYWLDAYQLWVKVFALSFALGVVSGITMSFQFGTNWPGFMKTVGNVAGPLLGFEVLSAFFLEATFLGIMLYGFSRVPNWLLTMATAVVAFGTTLSAFWIISLNSWMQSPRGYEVVDGSVRVTSWLEVIFNPTMPYTFSHMLLACFITVAFLLAGVSSYQILLGYKRQFILKTQKISIYLALVLLPIQMIVGDLVGVNAHKNQPAKVAAIEGLWETSRGIPAIIFAIPNEKERTNYFEIGIPKLSSLLITHSLDGEVKGLNEFKDKHPPVSAVFWAFRIMLGMGLIMFAASIFTGWQLKYKGKVSKFGNIILVLLTFSGWIATIAGWYVAEIGRQPYLVYNLLETKQAVSDVPPDILGTTLVIYLVTYLFLVLSYVYAVFFIANKVNQGGS